MTDLLIQLWQIKERENLTDKHLESALGVDRMTIYRWRKLGMKPSPLAQEKIEAFVKERRE
jgi:transcriptional regulator with XRE-family HTH domain